MKMLHRSIVSSKRLSPRVVVMGFGPKYAEIEDGQNENAR